MKRFIINVIVVFLAILASGIVMGALAVAAIEWGCDISIVGGIIIGLIVTSIPTVGYAVILVSVFKLAPSLVSHRISSLALSVAMTLGTFSLIFRKLSSEIPEIGGLMIPSILAGLVGTEVLIRRMRNEPTKSGQQGGGEVRS